MPLRALRDQDDARFEGGSYDLRHFDVRTAQDNEKIGVVDELLIDDRGRIQFISADLEGEHRHVLVPTEQATSDPDQHTVWLTGMRKDNLRDLPEYSGDPSTIDESYLSRLNAAYGQAHGGARGREGWIGGGSRGHHEIEDLDRLKNVEVAKGDPDPRGWEVTGSDGAKLGRIDHLVGDTDAMKVVYLVMKVDRGLMGDEPHVLIPTAHATLDEHHKGIRVNALNGPRLAAMPRYEGRLDRDHVREVERIFSGGLMGERQPEHAHTATEAHLGEERIERSEEELRIGKQQREAGAVEVEKTVETEHVREPVRVKHEEVEIERRPVTGEGRTPELAEDEIRVPITEEEVVVEKRPVVKEEIIVRKREVEEEEVVDETLRRERVDVRHEGETDTTHGRKG